MEGFSGNNDHPRAEFHSGMRGASTRVICRRSAGEPVTPVYSYLYSDQQCGHESCNLILACDGGRFLKVHKQVVIESSTYCRRKLRDAPEVNLLRVSGVSERVMKLVIKFMYLGKVTLDAKDDELREFLSAAENLGIKVHSLSKLDYIEEEEHGLDTQSPPSEKNNENETLQARFDRLTSCVFAKCTNYRRDEGGELFGDAATDSSSSHSFMMSSGSSGQISSASLATFRESLESDDTMQSVVYVPKGTMDKGMFARGKNVLSKLKIIHNNKQSGTDKQGISTTHTTINDQGESRVNITLPQACFPHHRNEDLEIHLRLRVALTRRMRMPQGLRRCFCCSCTRE